MRKARQARIVIDSIDGAMMASAHGESGEIVDAMVKAVMQMCREKPFMKNQFKRKIMREIVQKINLGYCVQTIVETLIASAVFLGLLYCFACFMHWLGA